MTHSGGGVCWGVDDCCFSVASSGFDPKTTRIEFLGAAARRVTLQHS